MQAERCPTRRMRWVQHAYTAPPLFPSIPRPRARARMRSATRRRYVIKNVGGCMPSAHAPCVGAPPLSPNHERSLSHPLRLARSCSCPPLLISAASSLPTLLHLRGCAASVSFHLYRPRARARMLSATARACTHSPLLLSCAHTPAGSMPSSSSRTCPQLPALTSRASSFSAAQLPQQPQQANLSLQAPVSDGAGCAWMRTFCAPACMRLCPAHTRACTLPPVHERIAPA